MKRFFTYILIVAALAFAASCTMESFQSEEDGDGLITISLKTAEMTSTRADGDEEETMEEIENKVTHADFFFFKDEEGTTLIDHTRLEVKAGELVPVEGEDNLYEYTFDVRTATNNGPLQGPSYVYVIANYPEEISETTLDGILGLDIKTDLSAEKINYFVMDSYDSASEKYMTYLSPSKAGDSKKYTIGLTRAAAKLVLNFNVKDEYVDEFGNKWTPETSQMWVNFVNALKTTTVEAAPAEFSDNKTDYFTTAQKSPVSVTPAAKAGYTSWTADAVYTYPQKFSAADVTAPYFKLYCPWNCTSKGLNNFYYKIILPELESFQRNKIYNLTVDVSVIGGTEDDWALVSDYIFVADWFAPKAVQAEFESALYLDVPVKYYEIYGLNSITVPVVSSNDIEKVSISARQQMVTETLGTDATHNIRDYEFTTDGKESFTLTYDLNSTIDLVTNYTANNPNRNFDCTPITWTVTIHHKPSTDEPYLPNQVTVTIVQYPSIYAKLVVGGDSFVNGYYSLQTASVSPTNSDETRFNASNQQNNNGAYYRYTNSTNPYSGSGTNGRADQNYGRLNTTVADKPNTMTLVTVTAFEENSNSYTVRSDGDGDGDTKYEYIIGDPRVPWGSNGSLYNYRSGSSTVAWDSNIVSNIMVSGSKKNVIAPAFMISSDLGGRPGATQGMTFEKALKRCATYQEAGYPAGRWRLPTEAEMYFTYSLQKMYVIGHLYNGGDGYYASSGNVFDWEGTQGNQPPSGRSRTSFIDANDANRYHSIRCVYDIWYWGEETPKVNGQPINVHQYYPGTLN